MDPKDNVGRGWDKFLNPEVLRHNLVVCALYLAAYELLRGSIVDRPRRFFTNYTAAGPEVDKAYTQDVLSLHPKDALHASCLWLHKNGAITDDDLAEFGQIRDHRNAIAHQLPLFISDVEFEVDLNRLRSIRQLAAKIERWWFREFEMTTNPTYDGVELQDEGIQPGTMLALDLVMHLALGQQTVQ